MDYSQILILIDKATKEFYSQTLKAQHDAAQKHAEALRDLADQLIEANNALRNQHGQGK